MRSVTDICILGAGPAGLSAALFLAKKGIPCTVLEKSKFPRDKICGDALSGKVLSVLKKLRPEVADELRAYPSALPSFGVSFIAPNGNILRVPFNKASPSLQAPGYTCKRIEFDHFLAEKVRSEPDVQMIQETTIRSFEKFNEGFCLKDKNEKEILTARLVIACDGAQSFFAKKYGHIDPKNKHYSAGLRQYFSGVKGMDPENFIELHFIKDLLPGYFWIFPLPNGDANVGLGIRSDVIARKRLNLKAIFHDIIKTHPSIKNRFSNAEPIESIKGFGLPLASGRRKISGDHFMLCGDAASLIDPFTGEGISNAMISGMFAAEQAERCLNQANFSSAYMQEYDQAVYNRLGKEFDISTKIQKLIHYPWLFNFFINKATRNKELSNLISCMFDDLDLRKKLKQPSFYLKLLK